uniref:Uncharacterized protein n=1 Tax=Marseillevirus LCMAC201 TaxID=2506605 RepID=A0A481YVN4_9VIRU|nr:MAG: hypothetical protein LCMAC201_01340 [Marseillevirus LCMAC201]
MNNYKPLDNETLLQIALFIPFQVCGKEKMNELISTSCQKDDESDNIIKLFFEFYIDCKNYCRSFYYGNIILNDTLNNIVKTGIEHVSCLENYKEKLLSVLSQVEYDKYIQEMNSILVETTPLTVECNICGKYIHDEWYICPYKNGKCDYDICIDHINPSESNKCPKCNTELQKTNYIE